MTMSEESSNVTYKGEADLTKSPLLSRPIMERNYDAIDTFSQQPSFDEQTPKTPINPATPQQQRPVSPQPQMPQTPTGQSTTGSSYTPPASPNMPPPPPTTEIPPFTPISDSVNDDFGDSMDSGSGSDAPLSDTGFKIPDISAKQFANIIVENYSTHGSKIFYNWCRIDMNNVEFHVKERNIRPDFVPLIEKANNDALIAIKLTDEEKSLLKRALKDYFMSVNAKFANPQNGLLLTLLMTVGRQVMTAKQMAKENKELLASMINATKNNGYYQTYTPNNPTMSATPTDKPKN
jgi:hypothetical protein